MDAKQLTTSSTETSKRRPESISALWAGMATMFGRRWTDSMGAEPNPLAAKLLGDWTMAEVEHALRAAMAAGLVHPPSLPELAALKTPPVDEHEARALAHRLVPSFERNVGDAARVERLVRENLPRARQLLAGAKPEGRERVVLEKMAGTALRVV